jgi:hypothetical protein
MKPKRGALVIFQEIVIENFEGGYFIVEESKW